QGLCNGELPCDRGAMQVRPGWTTRALRICRGTLLPKFCLLVRCRLVLACSRLLNSRSIPTSSHPVLIHRCLARPHRFNREEFFNAAPVHFNGRQKIETAIRWNTRSTIGRLTKLLFDY